MTAVEPPAPVVDHVSAPFWEALSGHRVVVQSCGTCGRHRFPRVPWCPYCGAEGGEDVVVDGRGTVYSFVRVHRALTPAMADQVPYTIATVDLDGGARMVGRVDPADAVAIGARVEPVFVDHADWTELRFRVGD